MLSPGAFNKTLLATLLGMILASATTFFLVDPRGMYQTLLVEGFNARKFSFYQREHIIKPYQVLSYEPDTILMGNSITNTAFDLQHPLFNGLRPYSYGIAGASVYTNWLTLQHLRGMPVSRAYYFIDFSSFFVTSPAGGKTAIDQSDLPARLRYLPDGRRNIMRPVQMLKDTGLSLLSWDILHDSLETIRRQDEDGWHLAADGTWQGTSTQMGKSQRKRFTYVEREIFMRPLLAHPANQSFHMTAGPDRPLEAFTAILRFFHQEAIQAVLVIPPFHARIYETLFAQGRWQDYRNWKKQLVAANEQIAREFGRAPFPFRDFSGYNAFTTEPVPAPGDRQSRMQWFYDSVHIKPELGRAVLDALFQPEAATLPGSLLTPDNVEKQLEAMQAGHLAYVRSHPDDLEDILAGCRIVFQDPTRCHFPQQATGHDR